MYCILKVKGLPHGCKPPPPPPPPQLAMQHPCGAGPQKARTMAAVSPLHQVVPPQPTLSPYETAGLNAFGPSQRTSSFAAALRKLAKQAGDPIVGEKDIAQISPVSSPALAQRSLTPKRNGHSSGQNPSMFLTSSGHQVNNTSFSSSSPPVVTIAPSRPHPTHTTDTRKVLDLGGLPSSNPSSSNISNGHLPESISLKLENNKTSSRNNSGDKWDDHVNKSLPTSSVTSQSRPHATIAPLPRPDDSLTSSRGFQPYRSAEDIRTSVPPHHLSPFEHHSPAAYPYTPAFLPPPHLPHPAYRIDDALFLDRYGLLRSQVMPFPGQPTMITSPSAFYPQSRYDLLAQSLSLSSANNSILHHERLKLEEERRQREKEVELDQSRRRELERREKEHKEKEHKEREQHKEKEHREKERREKSHRDKGDHGDHHKSSSHSKRADYANSRSEPPVHSTTPNHSSPSTPLNLVVQPNLSQNSTDHQKKETELWMPWQQNSSTPHHNAKDSNNRDDTNPAIISQYKLTENLRPPPQPTKDNLQTNPLEKFHAPYNLPYYADKKHSSVEPDQDSKKPTNVHHHHTASNNRKFDTLHHHIAELSKKESSSNEWKHEKLQRACTNNHRKSINDVKKVREETTHHHQQQQQSSSTATNAHSTHHRKHLNGIVKPVVLSQDEGMHARLLETEKCRIEFNNMKLQPPDKMQVPNLIHGALSSKGVVNSQMMCMDYNNHFMPMCKPTPVETVPLKSKLDKEAEDMKKKGSSDVENEESIKDFLILTKGPPIPFDASPKKMRYLKLLGLTSRLKRKKIEFGMYLKRRKLLMDTPRLMEEAPDEKDPKPLSEIYLNSESSSEKLRLQNNSKRTQFLSVLDLNPLSSAQKQENTRIQKVIEDERTRRGQREAKEKNKIPSPLEESDVKVEGNSKLLSSIQGEAKNTTQKATNKGEQVPYAETHPKEKSTSQALTSPGTWDSSQGANKIRTKYSFKRGYSLKREWTPPTLSSAMPNNQSLTNGPLEVKGERLTNVHHISTAVQVDLLVAAINDKKNKSKSFAFNWPGLEAIIEAYHRHNTEQVQERDVLRKKCNQLQLRQEELKKDASTFSKSMSDLLKRKREMEDQSTQTQQAIDNLKKCFQTSR